MSRTKYDQGEGFLVIQDYENTHHIPIREISHLKSGHENHAIFVLKSGKEIPTKHWMNRARKMLKEVTDKTICEDCDNFDIILFIKLIDEWLKEAHDDLEDDEKLEMAHQLSSLMQRAITILSRSDVKLLKKKNSKQGNLDIGSDT